MHTERPVPPGFAAPTAAWAGIAGRLMQAAPNGIAVVDIGGVIRYANARLNAIFGYLDDELIGRAIETLVPPKYRAAHVTALPGFLHAAMSRPSGTLLNLAGVRKDGTEVPVEVSLATVEDDRGALWGVAIVADSSARQAANERLQDLNRLYMTLAQANQAIVRAGSEQEVFDQTCRIVVDTGGFLAAWVGKPDATGLVVPVALAGPLGGYVRGLAITLDESRPRGRGPTATAWRTVAPVYVGNYGADAATRPWYEAGLTAGIHSSAALPLCVDGEPVALFNLYSSRADIFDDATRTLLEALAENVGFALRGFRNVQELSRLASERRILLRELVAAQEQERARIAADVHDDVLQVSAAADLRLGLLERRLAETAPELGEYVAPLRPLLAAGSRRLRELLENLEPPDPQTELRGLLDDAALSVLDDSGIDWQLDGDLSADLAPTERGEAQRIVKEALRNVRSHAAARSVRITLAAVEGGVEVSVEDDGVGFDPATVSSPPGHRGLLTMRQRAQICGGWLRLERSASGGGCVRFWLPGAAPTEGE
jgi:PAS domain S-box-containing protein